MNLLTSSLPIKPRFCINCKHFIPDKYNPLNSSLGKCGAFPIDNTNYLIDGSEKTLKHVYYYCSTARNFNHLCGKNGIKYFTPLKI